MYPPATGRSQTGLVLKDQLHHLVAPRLRLGLTGRRVLGRRSGEVGSDEMGGMMEETNRIRKAGKEE